MSAIEFETSTAADDPPPPPPVDSSDLDPIVVNLAELVGVLTPVDVDKTSYKLNDAWFANPIDQTSANVKNNGAALADLLGQLLGQVGGHALGIPVKDPGLLGTWYPINKPGTDPPEPTGLYFVTYQQGNDQVFGLGVLQSWTVALSEAEAKDAAASVGPAAIVVNVWGMLPCLKVGGGGLGLTLGQKGYPLFLGIEVEAKDGPIIDFADFSFDGIKFTANIDVQADDPVELSLVVMQLKLPDEEKPSDRSLADLSNISGGELLSTAASLFISALGSLTGTSERAALLLPVLGLTPGKAAVKLPVLGWDKFLELAKSGGNLSEPFIDWFTQLLSKPEWLQTWLTDIAGLLGISSPTVSGTGSRTSPYLIPLIVNESLGQVSFSAASTVDAQGQRHFYPGINFESAGITLGSSPAVVKVESELELAEFVLTLTGPPSYVGPSSLNFTSQISLVNKDAAQPLISADGYSFDSLEGGLSLSAGPKVVPSFALVNVKTPKGNYESIDLTQPGELADIALEQLFGLIDSAFRKLFGIDNPEAAFGSGVAAIIGIIPPALPDGVEWPAALAPPLSASQLVNTVQNPIAALGSYYARLLRPDTPVGGKTPFFYVLQEMAGLLKTDTASPVSVAGDGTAASPWRATLTTLTLPAALTAYVQDVSGSPDLMRLVLGLSLDPQVTAGGVNAALAFGINVLSLDLSKSDPLAPVHGSLLPNLSVTFALPDGFTTPAVLGAQLKVGGVALSALWSRFDGWHWSMLAAQPTLIVDGADMPVGEDLSFSDQQSLEELVTKEAHTFAPILLGVLGLAVSRTQVRAGLALTGILGLLPKLDAFMPAGIDWPAGMPTLKLTDFSDPLGAIRTQAAGIFSSAENARAALTLLGWSFGVPDSPVIALTGSGDFNDPFRVPFGAQTSFNIPVWFESAGPSFGAGLGRTFVTTLLDSVEATTDVRLNAFNVPLGGAAPAPSAQVPSLSVQTTLKKAGGPLITLPGGQGTLDHAALGFVLALDAQGNVGLSPVVELSTTGAQDSAATLLTQADDSEQFFSLLNLVIQLVVEDAKDNPTFQTVYGLLADMGLMLEVKAAGDPHGINPAGWLGLTANPLAFAGQGLQNILADKDARHAFFTLIQQVLGVSLPGAVPEALLEFLSALGFLESADLGYVIKPERFVALAAHPVRTLGDSFQALVTDPTRLAALVSALNQSSLQVGFGVFTFEAVEGTKIRLSIARDKPFAVGTLINLSGEISFDLKAFTLSGSLRAYNPTVGFALTPQLSFTVPGGTASKSSAVAAAGVSAPSLTLRLEWGDGTAPAPAPLQFYPFDGQKFIDELADVAPAFALSVFVNGIVEKQLLNQYPLAQAAFLGLGIAYKDEHSNTWYMKSPLGLLDDPLGWLLSDSVVGASGRLDLPRLQNVLKSLPAVTTGGGLALAQVTNGVRLSGLPYNVYIDLLVDLTRQVALFNSGLSEPVPVAGGKGSVDKLDLGLSLGPNFQPGISGSITVSGDVGLTDRVFVQTGYDKGFELAFGEAGPNNPTLQLLPFAGWQSLVAAGTSIFAQELLQDLTSKLLDELSKRGAADFVAKLRSAAGDLDVRSLLDAVVAAQPDLEKMETAALSWLRGRLSDQNISNTTQAVSTLFQGVVPGVSAQNGLISYTPGASLPVTLLLGKSVLGGIPQLGLWVQLELPKTSILQATVAQTGIGVPMSGALTPHFNFGIDLLVPIEGDSGPQLSFNYNPAGQTFELDFDPLYDPKAGHSELRIQLFPDLFGTSDAGQLAGKAEQWLGDVLLNVLPRYVSLVVLNTATVSQWLNAPIVGQGPSPGFILKAAQLLQQDATTHKYALTSFNELKQLTPEKFLAKFLQALLSQQFKVFTINETGGIWIGPSEVGSSNYGLRIKAPDLKIPGLPNLVIQLGADDDAWIAEAGGSTEDHESGISVYIPIEADAPHFEKLRLNFVNVGVDFGGKGDAPLVNTSRFTLGKIEPRTYLTLDFGASPVAHFGAAITLYQMGLSLTPNAATGSSSNPVAQNLLGSGDGTAADQKNPPTNPTFSVRAGYISDLYVDLLGDTGSSETKIWIPVQRSFGPVHAEKIGLGWEKEITTASVLFDGSVSLAGLMMELVELSVGFNVKRPLDYGGYKLDLAGLDVSYKGGSVTIAGGFLKATDPLRYDGQALVKAASFSLYAVGSYAVIPIHPDDPQSKTAPSLFIFVSLNVPLGGPPEFFILGLAGGFSYNRNITIPLPGEIQDFPLVAGAMNPDYFGDGEPSTALAKLSEVVAPEIGQYWIAAGIRFSTYELLNCFALLFVKFGREFEIDLVGLALLALPQGAPTGTALAYMELGLVISFKPASGLISVFAQLTPNSYVIYKDCKLTGGFAFFLWYSGEHAGDCVVTLGGYNPAFDKPEHYPEVPRLGFNWPITSSVGSVSISGGAYFALTPSAVMAGGYLKVLFETGPLRAWLTAAADFLISWKPFYYLINVEVSIGVSFSFKLAGVSVTLSVELGATLELYGPPTAGKAHVSWYVISFTIPFGDQSQQSGSDSKPLLWEAFSESFLPKPAAAAPAPQQAPARASMRAAAMLADDAPRDGEPQQGVEQQVVKVSASTGLLPSDDAGGWTIQAVPFVFNAKTAIPSTDIEVSSSNYKFTGPGMGVRPMDLPSVDTPVTVSIYSHDEKANVNFNERGILVEAVTSGSADALWGKTAFDPDGAPSASMTPNALVGVVVTAKDYAYANPIGPMPLEQAFGHESKPDINLPYDLTPAYTPAQPLPQDNPIRTIMDTIMSEGDGTPAHPNVIRNRNAVFQALNDNKLSAPLNPSLYVMRAAADQVLQAPPILAPIGIFLSNAPDPGRTLSPRTQTRAASDAGDGGAGAAPRLLGGIRRYTSATNASAASPHPLLLSRAARTSGQWVDARTHTTSRRALRSFAAAPAEGQNSDGQNSQDQNSEDLSVRLFEGSTVLWDLGGDAVGASVHTQGGLPLRFSCFNRYAELLADTLHDPAASELELPDGTSHVALHGAGQSSNGGETTVGWQLDTSLLKVNHYYFLGEGFALRPQAALRVYRKGRLFRRGTIDARQVLEENRVQTGNRSTRPGWLETVVSSRMNRFAVTVRSGGRTAAEVADALRVSASFEDNPAGAEHKETLSHVHSFEGEGGTVLIYEPTAGADSGKPYLCILTEPLGEDVKLLGVYAMSHGEAPGDMAAWQNLSLTADGVNPLAPELQSSVATLKLKRG